jgi:outer membrane receptor protein involved in Fe transport
LTLEPAPEVSWNLEGRFVDHNPAVYNGPQDSPPVITTLNYWVWNTEFRWEITKGMRFFLSLDNLLNQTYATGQGLPMPGRTMEAGTMIEF